MRDETLVLIGAGQFTFRGSAENSPSVLELLRIAAKCAVAGSRLRGMVLARLQALVVVAFGGEAASGVSGPPRSCLLKHLAARAA
ncbi:hypothetical protein [Caulobacter hibisci]|uniref:Uncharacterized protein n=1 Tax=Caulobacter hibisci TaxID=2035993 RepID=A0ABS0STY7_9CAUL|nr:hypothetical protein [Caulobacter hibisci]MBI1683089.1 hypothetical protein [Caulobacter hibisci]